jgi:outer membrane protein assembly factor BamB
MTPLLIALALAAPAPKDEKPAARWWEFRGPDGVGHYTGPAVPTAWGPSANVAWKADIPGSGWSSPVLLNGKLYLTTAVPKGADFDLRVVCVDAANGKIDWDQSAFVEDGKTVPQPHKKNSHASPTAVSDGKHVFVHFGHMGTACLDFNGKIIWQTQELAYKPVHGNGASPILVGDNVIFSCDGGQESYVASLDKNTGKVRWKTDRKSTSQMKFSFATSLLIEVDGKPMVVSPGSDWVMGLDPATGEELWRAKYPNVGFSLIPRPLFGHGMLYICTGYMAPNLIALKPGGTGDISANIAWSIKKNAPNTPTPVLVGDEIYMLSDSGFLTCMDAKTGKVHYSERLEGKGYSASLIVADGNIYATSEDGVGQVIPVGTEFKPSHKSSLGERTFATFAPVDGALFVRTDKQIYRFEKK